MTFFVHPSMAISCLYEETLMEHTTCLGLSFKIAMLKKKKPAWETAKHDFYDDKILL